jgi:hypothetical protein
MSKKIVCTSYAPGHNVHYIQALHSANQKAVSAQTWPGKVVAVDGEILTVRKPGGDLTRFRIHNPAGLVAILEHVGVDVTVNDQYAILRAGITRTGSSCISVQTDSGEPLRPCPTDDLPSNPADQQRAADIRTKARFRAPDANPTKSRRTR